MGGMSCHRCQGLTIMDSYIDRGSSRDALWLRTLRGLQRGHRAWNRDEPSCPATGCAGSETIEWHAPSP